MPVPSFCSWEARDTFKRLGFDQNPIVGWGNDTTPITRQYVRGKGTQPGRG